MQVNSVLNLFEGVSSILFHHTSFRSALKMLRSNKMIAKHGEHSFSRSIAGEYPSQNRMIGVLMKLDGKKLSQKYKGAPVGTEDFYDGGFRGRENRQFEDRLYGKEIDNLWSYVIDLIIVIPLEYMEYHGEDSFEESYVEQLDFLPTFDAYVGRFNDLRYALSRNDLMNRKFVNERVAKERLREFFTENGIEVSGNLKSFLGIKEEEQKFRVLYDIYGEDGKTGEEFKDTSHLDFVARSKEEAIDALKSHHHDINKIIDSSYETEWGVDKIKKVSLHPEMLWTGGSDFRHGVQFVWKNPNP